MKSSKFKAQSSKLQFKILPLLRDSAIYQMPGGKNLRFGIFILIFAFCFLNFYGCAGLSKKQDSTPKNLGLLEPSSILKFSDVPVPTGFKLLPQKSYSFESSGVRVGVLRYQGKANPDQVVNFYKEQMPMYNWNLLNVIEYGDRLINFDRENETCNVALLPKGNTLTITVSLGPKPQIPKKANKPVK